MVRLVGGLGNTSMLATAQQRGANSVALALIFMWMRLKGIFIASCPQGAFLDDVVLIQLHSPCIVGHLRQHATVSARHFAAQQHVEAQEAAAANWPVWCKVELRWRAQLAACIHTHNLRTSRLFCLI